MSYLDDPLFQPTHEIGHRLPVGAAHLAMIVAAMICRADGAPIRVDKTPSGFSLHKRTHQVVDLAETVVDVSDHGIHIVDRSDLDPLGQGMAVFDNGLGLLPGSWIF